MWINTSSTTNVFQVETRNLVPKILKTPLQSQGGATYRHYVNEEATRYTLREQEGGDNKGGEWTRKTATPLNPLD